MNIFDVVFKDTNYFPDELTVKLKSSAGTEVQAVNTGSDIVGGPEYVNATFGRFDILAIPAGEYAIELKDRTASLIL